MKKIAIYITLLLLSASCQTSREEVMTLSPPANDFKGIDDLIKNSEPVSFILLHGMDTDDPDWASDYIINIINKMGRSGIKYSLEDLNDANNKNIAIKPVFTLPSLYLKAVYFKQENVTFYIPMYYYISNQVIMTKLDDGEPTQTINSQLQQELFYNGFSNAIIAMNSDVSSIYDELIMSTLIRASKSNNTIVISESLGSYVFNSFLARTNQKKDHTDRELNALYNIKGIFYLSNQVDLLSLSLDQTGYLNDETTLEESLEGTMITASDLNPIDWNSFAKGMTYNRVSYKKRKIVNNAYLATYVMDDFNNKFILNESGSPRNPVTAVAITDPDDILSFPLTQTSEDKFIANVYVSTTEKEFKLPFFDYNGKKTFNNPLELHLSYINNEKVLELLFSGY